MECSPSDGVAMRLVRRAAAAAAERCPSLKGEPNLRSPYGASAKGGYLSVTSTNA
jgi:hypothetical protein